MQQIGCSTPSRIFGIGHARASIIMRINEQVKGLVSLPPLIKILNNYKILANWF